MSDFLVYLITGLGTGCGIALIGSGLVLIHRVTRVVNFAQGTFAVVAALTAVSLLGMGVPHGLAELLGVAVAALVGLLFGAIAIGRRGTSPQAALMVTLGLGVLAYAVEVMIWGDQGRSSEGLAGAVTLFGARVQTHYLLVIGVTVAVFAAMAALFGRTDAGKALSACSSNPYAARVVGISVTRMGLIAFTVGGALGGLAGVLLTPMNSVSFDSDVALIINGFAAAVVGSMRHIGRTLAGALFLGVAEAMVAGYGSAAYQSVVALGLILALMIGQAARTRSVVAEAG
ncbi:branched-chain amino acid ABC transporter permease [Streptomyces griseiscabiei]|uniref:Branched-chain amino acid ABC transporter permease n=1 Tax=Streptomyces griseiscabiei TaxID=2993540 RepID=A0ABU4LC14_9ACTN|nr:branched-chain amino acid ABC transporter permease [Streptomyces griseiscabiei]MBZ3900255.1 branched-chain amino acid ABC transporter permease [Streptomyces griseiscabiei]MDX2913264.1 branched-chain amino acid ABC transporter permease [Streptomyces griseiscabiei]